MTESNVKQLSRAFRALSNPNRLQLFLNLVRQGGGDVSDGSRHTCFLTNILSNMNIGAPTVSHHVKELVDAGLIQTERDGKQLTCSINTSMLQKLKETLDLNN